MTLGRVDWALIALYLGVTLALGLLLSRRGRQSVNEYFVAGRRLSWWLAGTSIVATSFAADTPLAIARIVRVDGLQGNWYWWSGVMGFVFCMFFFAPLWRRSALLTDVELIDLRYEGRPARALRTVLALHKSVLVNGITMGWVLLGMQKIAVETFGWPRAVSIPLLLGVALAYTAISGLWGVVVTDLFQFVVAMLGSICLMVIVLHAAGGPAELAARVAAAPAVAGGEGLSSAAAKLSFFPAATDRLALVTFLFFVLVQWWGGAEGGGFLVQRLFATKNERHAVLALLWFTVAHFGLRCWPWIVVGLGSLVFFPELIDPEAAYPKMMMRFLPVGLKGLMVASLLAAFMSTISTHLNWGASYLLTDVYRPLVGRRAGERHYVRAAQVFVVTMALLAAVLAWKMESIFGAWIYLTEIGAGVVLVGLLRWYWWRINAWSEISALGASLLVSNGLRAVGSVAGGLDRLGWSGAAEAARSLAFLAEPEWYPARFLLTLGISTAVWLAVTLATRPVARDKLEAFYRRVRPAGWWAPVARACPDVPRWQVGRQELVAWGLGVATVYGLLFGLGMLLFGDYLRAALTLAGAVAAGGLLLRTMRRLDWDRPVAAGGEAG